MTDKKVSELDTITGADTAADDYFLIVDTSGSVSKKISRAELNNAIEQDVLSVVDINGGTIDGTTIGGSSAAVGTFTTANATTVDTTNIEVTNIKAKDGTAAGSIADATGVVTLASSVLTTTDINGGTIDGTTIGGTTAAAGTFTTFTSTGIDDNASSTALTIDSSQNATFSSDVTAEGYNLSAIATDIADTAVDVFIYDTNKDSDGGAWRHRTQNTSWYNETLNTSTRGSRKEFPAVAVIVAEATQVTIYDGDDPDLPMWLVFDYHAGSTITSISALNGQIWIGFSNVWPSLGIINFLADFAELRDDRNSNGTNRRAWVPLTASYYDGFSNLTTTTAIVDEVVNDVAMTVLPNAPIDADTGLPVPTIAVATDGGVSVIKDDGTVVDITASNATYGYSRKVHFSKDNYLYVAFDNASGDDYGWVYGFKTIPTSDNVITVNSRTGSTQNADFWFDSRSPLIFSQDVWLGGSASASVGYDISAMSEDAYATSQGLVVVDVDETTPANSMSSIVTSDYNTGWMQGDIKLALLANSKTADRSVNANNLTENGTVTESAVETGAELLGYSGFSSSNYLEQPYNSDLDFGTGDFCMMCWVNMSSGVNNTQTFFARGYWNGSNWNSAPVIILNGGVAGSPQFKITDDGFASEDAAQTSLDLDNGVWHQLCGVRRGSTLELWIDGVLDTTTTISNATGSLDNSNATLMIGEDQRKVGTGAADQSSIALSRISATAPSAAQIKKIYEDEKFLFQDNADATLYGSSDAVTALAYDSRTELLHAGTSAGRSVFQGLRRVDNTTDAVTATISASNGLVADD